MGKGQVSLRVIDGGNVHPMQKSVNRKVHGMQIFLVPLFGRPETTSQDIAGQSESAPNAVLEEEIKATP